ncbi:MAG: hypothetical protein QM504_18595, partial [Pseudomonadota bacterium]
NEASFFNVNNLKYFYIPVLFEKPRHRDVIIFFGIMDKYKDHKVFIHCAANKRVSVFMALYRIIKLGWQKDKAFDDVLAIWEPNDIWQSFINHQLSNV